MTKRRSQLIALVCAVTGTLAAVPAQAATTFTLTGHGWGHGIGLSQYGALGYAQHGWKYPNILTHYFTGTHIAKVTSTFNERVLLLSGPKSVDVRFSTPVKVGAAGLTAEAVPAGSYRLQFGTTPGRLQLVNLGSGKLVLKGLVTPVTMAPQATPIELDHTAGMWDSGHHWRGDLIFRRSGASLLVINSLPVEKYVAAVVPNEVSASWPVPAVRAQAVAVRSYAYATRSPSHVQDATLASQTYGPIEREAAGGTAAATYTKGQVVYFGSTIATTFYSSSSGGRTSSEQASWGVSSGPAYLVPVSDPYDAAGGANPNHTWAPRAYSPTQLAAAFGLSQKVASVDQTWDPASLREQTLTLHNAAGAHSWSGLSVDSMLGLRSDYYRFVQMTLGLAHANVHQGDQIVISGRVWPRPSGPVKLLRRMPGSSTWTVAVASLTLGTEGRFTVRTNAVSSRSFRLGSSTGAISPVVSLTVSAAVPKGASVMGFRPAAGG